MAPPPKRSSSALQRLPTDADRANANSTPHTPPTPPIHTTTGPELNAAQAEAAAHGNSPLLIVAGAGTGKTRTLIHRVAHLIKAGVSPSRILLLTFTRRSADEMLSRCQKLVGGASKLVQGGTFHAVAHRLLRRFGPSAGLPPDFSILDQSDAIELLAISRSELGYNETKVSGAPRFPRAETLLALYSKQINTGQDVHSLLTEQWPHFAAWAGDIERLFADYIKRKADRSLLDYDDLLLSWALLLEHESHVATEMRSLFEHVLVDEYQDTNPLQARILRALCTHGRISAVGDDAQSIYSFRGATVRNILDFPSQFPGTHIVTLERNYRSTPFILQSSNTLISRAQERFTKELYTDRSDGEPPWLVTVRDEREQTSFVVDRILQLHNEGTPLHEIAVLVRAGYHSADLEIELANRRIPFEKWGGLKFLEAAHIKDILSFLRVLENPRDEVSWTRILRLLPGVGDATARYVISELAAHSWDPAIIAQVRAPSRAAVPLRTVAALITGLRNASTHPPSEEIRIARQLYDELLKLKYDDHVPRLADLDQMEMIAAGYPGRSEFLAAIALEPPRNTQDLAVGSTDEDDALVISTVHSAKGHEWDAVFVLNAADGVYPMARSAGDENQLEEERRLLYVAMTRPRSHLFVTHPLYSYSTRTGADYSYTQLSRFIDAGVRGTMQRVTVSDGTLPSLNGTTTPETPAVDLLALLRGRLGNR